MSTVIASIDKVHRAIAAGILGQIQWDDRSDERARSNPDLQGLTPQGIRRLLREFVVGGGRLDERQEARADWLEANADRPVYYRDFWSSARPVSEWPVRRGPPVRRRPTRPLG